MVIMLSFLLTSFCMTVGTIYSVVEVIVTDHQVNQGVLRYEQAVRPYIEEVEETSVDQGGVQNSSNHQNQEQPQEGIHQTTRRQEAAEVEPVSQRTLIAALARGNFEQFMHYVEQNQRSVFQLESNSEFNEKGYTVFHNLCLCKPHFSDTFNRQQIACLLWLLRQEFFDEVSIRCSAQGAEHFLYTLIKRRTRLAELITQQEWRDILNAINRSFIRSRRLLNFDIAQHGCFYKDNDAEFPLLFFAAKNNLSNLVNVLLERGLAVYDAPTVDINARDSDSNSLLYYAITHGLNNLIAHLLRYNPREEYNRLSVHDLYTGQTPLMLAIGQPNIQNQLAAPLVKSSLDVINDQDQDGKTALHKAISRGRVDFVRSLLSVRDAQTGESLVNLSDINGIYKDILLYAMDCNASREIYALLLNHGAFIGKIMTFVNEQIFNQNFITAYRESGFLYNAILAGDEELVGLALTNREQGNRGNNDIRDRYFMRYELKAFGNIQSGQILEGQTPLMVLSYKNFSDQLMKRAITSFASIVDVSDSLGETVLHKAIAQRKTSLVKLLLEAKKVGQGDNNVVQLTKQQVYRDILLYAASWNAPVDIIKLLIDHGARCDEVENLVNPDIFPLDFAQRFANEGLRTIFDVLVKYKHDSSYIRLIFSLLLNRGEQFGLQEQAPRIRDMIEQQKDALAGNAKYLQVLYDISRDLQLWIDYSSSRGTDVLNNEPQEVGTGLAGESVGVQGSGHDSQPAVSTESAVSTEPRDECVDSQGNFVGNMCKYAVCAGVVEYLTGGVSFALGCFGSLATYLIG